MGTNYEKMNVAVRDSMIGYVFKEKNRLRKINDGGGVLMLPPASLGVPPPIRWLVFTKHPQI